MRADLAFQTVLYPLLRDAVAPVSVEVHPAHGKALPFVRIGDTETSDYPAGGKSLLVEVHVWSSAEGSHEAKSLQEDIHDVLHDQALFDVEWKFSPIRENDGRVFLDVDNETWHGVQRFLVIATPVNVVL